VKEPPNVKSIIRAAELKIKPEWIPDVMIPDSLPFHITTLKLSSHFPTTDSNSMIEAFL
jgi:hypothetical protein